MQRLGIGSDLRGKLQQMSLHFSMIPFSPNLAPQIPAAMVILISTIFPIPSE